MDDEYDGVSLGARGAGAVRLVGHCWLFCHLHVHLCALDLDLAANHGIAAGPVHGDCPTTHDDDVSEAAATAKTTTTTTAKECFATIITTIRKLQQQQHQSAKMTC